MDRAHDGAVDRPRMCTALALSRGRRRSVHSKLREPVEKGVGIRQLDRRPRARQEPHRANHAPHLGLSHVGKGTRNPPGHQGHSSRPRVSVGRHAALADALALNDEIAPVAAELRRQVPLINARPIERGLVAPTSCGLLFCGPVPAGHMAADDGRWPRAPAHDGALAFAATKRGEVLCERTPCDAFRGQRERSYAKGAANRHPGA